MPAQFKDYPLYVYDDPAIYNRFTGGINSNPNNEHLDEDELRDCLNMHYNSAGLIKRPGAKQLCTITCNTELFNIQSVFLFTYKVTYLVIASDGKLYSGLYNENITIDLKRIHIYVDNNSILDYNSPTDMTIGLQTYYKELSNQSHNGYICRYFISENGEVVSQEDLNIYDLLKDVRVGTTLPKGTVIKHNDLFYLTNNLYTKRVITPTNEILSDDTPEKSGTEYWVECTTKNLTKYYNIVEAYVSNNLSNAPLVEIFKTEYADGFTTYTLKSKDSINLWTEQPADYTVGELIRYSANATDEAKVYICIKQHNCLTDSPSKYSSSFKKLYYKDSLVFQNKRSIEMATFNNKCYITTGTRFVELYLLNNELRASVIKPYQCSYNEILKLGFNLLSPYPEKCTTSLYNQVNTSMSFLNVTKNIYGVYTLTPIATYENDLTEKDMLFKWEKFINNRWVTIISFKDNYMNVTKPIVGMTNSSESKIDVELLWEFDKTYNVNDECLVIVEDGVKKYKCIYKHNLKTLVDTETGTDNTYFDFVETYNNQDLFEEIESYNKVITKVTYEEVTVKKDYSKLNVLDADIYKYRVTMCDSLKLAKYSEYPLYNPNNSYDVGDIVYVEKQGQYVLYKCITKHTPSKVDPDSRSLILFYLDEKNNQVSLWNLLEFIQPSSAYKLNDKFLALKQCYKFNFDTDSVDTYFDLIPDDITGTFGQATSILYKADVVNTFFSAIQSCSKITIDGNKMLLYGDSYNSGCWYKTKIDNPAYITERGCLSFKTTKNEELIKVISFSNNLIAFANSSSLGGSIHLVSGNGDDYDEDRYYSPYKRRLITSSISCDNYKTVQVCENYLIFKSYSTVYFIISSDISNDVVNIYTANDKIKLKSPYYKIPWEDNTCISEVTEDYYALIWKEKYTLTNTGLVLDHPAMKIKLYYKLAKTTNQKVYFPWLRDESQYFNIDNILYIKGSPVYLYNNILVSFNDSSNYKDLNTVYKCFIKFKGVDTNYPKLLKVLNSLIVYYYNSADSKITLNTKVTNESGHVILDSANQKKSLQNLRTLKVGSKLDKDVKLDYNTVSSKVFNTTYKFPYLLAEAELEAETESMFALSSLTYIYTSMDTPDQTLYDVYAQIIRKKEI